MPTLPNQTTRFFHILFQIHRSLPHGCRTTKRNAVEKTCSCCWCKEKYFYHENTKRKIAVPGPLCHLGKVRSGDVTFDLMITNQRGFLVLSRQRHVIKQLRMCISHQHKSKHALQSSLNMQSLLKRDKSSRCQSPWNYFPPQVNSVDVFLHSWNKDNFIGESLCLNITSSSFH